MVFWGSIFDLRKRRHMSNPKVEPFLRWAGSKRKLLPRLATYWGAGHERYLEPFMGSASLFFSLRPKRAILSDLNAELVETFLCVKNDPDAVYSSLVAIRRGKRSYNSIRRIDPESLGVVQRVARFIFLNRFCFNGLFRTNALGRF